MRINLCNIFPRNGRAIRVELKGELQQRHVRRRQVRVAIVAEQLIELFLRFAEQTQHLIMRVAQYEFRFAAANTRSKRSFCRRERDRSLKRIDARRPVSASTSLGNRLWQRKSDGTNPKCSRKAEKGAKETPSSTSRRKPIIRSF